MKFKSNNYLKDQYGEYKIQRKFMWIPRSFGEKYCRWLSFENVLYTVRCNGFRYKWVPDRFATEEDLNVYKFEKKNTNWLNVLFHLSISLFLTMYYFSNNISNSNIFLSITIAIIITRLIMNSKNFQNKGDPNV